MAETRKFLIKNFKVLVFFLGFLILSAGVVYAFTGPGSQSPGSGSGAITVSGDNVGIGTTDPAWKLDVDGAIGLWGNGYSLGGDAGGILYRPTESGSAGSRWALRFDLTDNASYPYLTNRTPGGDVVIKTGTAAGGGENEHFRIEGGDGTVDAYFTNTNVGIGTTAPQGKLDVSEGDSGASPNTNYDSLVVENNDHAGISILTPNNKVASIVFGDPENNLAGRIRYNHSTNDMTFLTDGSERLLIDADGNVGIGTTAPNSSYGVEIDTGHDWSILARGGINMYGERLLMTGTSSNNTRLEGRDRSQWTGDLGTGYGKMEYHAGRWYIASYDSDSPIFHARNASGSNVFTVNNNGSVDMNNYLGIGNSADSSYSIYIAGNTAYGIRAFGSTMGGRFEDSNSSARAYAGYGSYDIYANGTGLIQATGSMRAPIFYDSNNTSYYINPGSTGTSGTFAGSVGIGTTSPGADLHVGGSTCTGEGCGSNDIWASADITAGDDVIAVDKFKFAGTPTGGTTLCYQDASISPFFEIIRCSSSERFKENIEDLNFDAIGTIKKLRPVEYNWIEENGGKRDLGFIAEEVAQIDPILAIYEKDEEGNERVLSVKYDHITALLTKAIQEQQTIIKENQEKIRSLEERIEKIENGNRID